MEKQSLDQAVFLARTGKSEDMARAARCLNGLPVGGWAETEQAFMRLAEYLPQPHCRAYTVAELVDQLYEVRGANAWADGRYYTRPDAPARP